MRVRSIIAGVIVLGLIDCGKPSEDHPEQPTLRTDRTALDFGKSFGTAVWVNTSPQESLLIENLGLQPLVIQRVDQSGDRAFEITLPEKLEVGPLEHTFIRVTFTPTEARDYAGALSIISNAANEPQKSIQLSGKGVKP